MTVLYNSVNAGRSILLLNIKSPTKQANESRGHFKFVALFRYNTTLFFFKFVTPEWSLDEARGLIQKAIVETF